MKILSSTSMVLLLIISAYHFELLWIFGASRKSPCLSLSYSPCPSLTLIHSPHLSLSNFLLPQRISLSLGYGIFPKRNLLFLFEWMRIDFFFFFWFWFQAAIFGLDLLLTMYTHVCVSVYIKTLLRKWASGQLVVRNLAHSFVLKEKWF